MIRCIIIILVGLSTGYISRIWPLFYDLGNVACWLIAMDFPRASLLAKIAAGYAALTFFTFITNGGTVFSHSPLYLQYDLINYIFWTYIFFINLKHNKNIYEEIGYMAGLYLSFSSLMDNIFFQGEKISINDFLVVFMIISNSLYKYQKFKIDERVPIKSEV